MVGKYEEKGRKAMITEVPGGLIRIVPVNNNYFPQVSLSRLRY
jgi:hypothetical protein